MSDIRRSLGPAYGGQSFGEDKAEYLFGRIKRLKQAFTEVWPDIPVLDFGIGEPYEGPGKLVQESIKQGVDTSALDGYPDLGLPYLREAVVEHLGSQFGLSRSHNNEGTPLGAPLTEDNVQDCWGIKPALDTLIRVFCAPGDTGSWPDPRIQVAVTKPGYPVFGTQAAKLGAEVIELPVNVKNDYVPDLSALESAENLSAIYLISPHNPTGRAYDTVPGFWENLIAFCKRKMVALIVDEAYCHLRWCNDGKPFTVLSVPGFLEIGVVLQSCSKTLNWTGGRVGWVVGNEWIVKAYRKEYEDSSSGQTLALQYAAAQALHNFNRIVPFIHADYEQRMNGLLNVLQDKGFPVRMPDGGFFVYGLAPKSKGRWEFADAEEFMQYLLDKHGIVSVPFGDHIRFSCTMKIKHGTEPAGFDQALKMLASRLPDDLAW